MYGKIARLAREIREELNHRLDDNVPGERVLAWLNRQEPVRTVLKEQFGGVRISKQNLSEWRLGGFARWQAQRELLTQARDMAEDAEELSTATDGRLTDHLATVLAARYAAVLSNWSGEVSEGMQQQLKSLHGLCRNIVALRRGDYHGTRLRLEEERTELEREKTKEEMLAYFEKWVENCKVQALLAESEPDGLPASPKSKVQNPKSRGNKKKKGKVRAGRATKRISQRDVPTNPEECDGRLRQLFGLPAKTDSNPDKVVERSPSSAIAAVAAPPGEGETLAASVSKPASGGTKSRVRGGGRSRSVKHSQTSDGGTVALQELDVALAENTKPVISEAEKTLHFMRTLFGEPPPHVVDKILNRKSEPDGPPQTNEEAPSGVAPEANDEMRMQNEETEVPSPPHPNVDSFAPAHSALRPPALPDSFCCFPSSKSLPRGGEGTRAASRHESASGCEHHTIDDGAQGSPSRTGSTPAVPTGSKSQGASASDGQRSCRLKVESCTVIPAAASEKDGDRQDACPTPISENPPRRVQEIPPYSRTKMIRRCRPIESKAPVDRTHDFRGDPL